MEGNKLKIGEFAKKSGVTVKTLLHYDKMDYLSLVKKLIQDIEFTVKKTY